MAFVFRIRGAYVVSGAGAGWPQLRINNEIIPPRPLNCLFDPDLSTQEVLVLDWEVWILRWSVGLKERIPSVSYKSRRCEGWAGYDRE